MILFELNGLFNLLKIYIYTDNGFFYEITEITKGLEYKPIENKIEKLCDLRMT